MVGACSQALRIASVTHCRSSFASKHNTGAIDDALPSAFVSRSIWIWEAFRIYHNCCYPHSLGHPATYYVSRLLRLRPIVSPFPSTNSRNSCFDGPIAVLSSKPSFRSFLLNCSHFSLAPEPFVTYLSLKYKSCCVSPNWELVAGKSLKWLNLCRD